MYRKIQDFQGSWAYETEATLKVFGALTDESLQQVVYPGGRTLGRIAWHIVQTLPEMGNRTGLKVKGPGETDPIPASAGEIVARFREAAESLGSQIGESWTDADLEVEESLRLQQGDPAVSQWGGAFITFWNRCAKDVW